MSLLQAALEPSTLVVAVDPGKVANRVWLSDGSGLLVEPVSMPVSRAGLAGVEAPGVGSRRGTSGCGGRDRGDGQFAPCVVERVGTALSRCGAAVRAVGDQGGADPAGSGRFKTDDRDCAALTYLARQGAGRRWVDEVEIDALRAVVRHRRGLVHDRKVIQQRLHDQLNALAPGLSAPAGHGRSLALDQPSGQAVLACAAAFAGRPPTVRSLQARATGRFSRADARVLGAAVARLPATAARC